MTNTKKQNVIWRTYPGIDFLQANQFGEVRTVDHYTVCKDGKKQFVKGHILKQYPNKKGYMRVYLYVNGKKVTLGVHRIVATCFLPNPENLPQVNHLDCNPANNRLDNLEFCTNSYNVAYREKFGKACSHSVFAVNLKTLEKLFFESQNEAARQLGVQQAHVNDVLAGRRNQTGGYWFTENGSEITTEKIQEIKDRMIFLGRVVAVDLKTFKVLRFESQTEAARQLGISRVGIGNVLRGKIKQTGGYWFVEDESEITKEKIQEIKDGMVSRDGVVAVNLETSEVSRFESQHEAARQLEIDVRSINMVLKSRLKKTHGYWFCYADEHAVENIRAKFGDEAVNRLN